MSAQQSQFSSDVIATPTAISESELARSQNQPEDFVQTTRGGDVFFCEDFSNGFDGNNPYGAWTIEDSGDNTIWMMADNQSPGGLYAGGTVGLASPSAANGWVIFDADLYNSQFGAGAYVDVTGYLTSPVINMESLETVLVDYSQYFRFCCESPTVPMALEVTVNGGDEWLSFPSHGDAILSVNSISDNPVTTTVDISCAAAGQSAVQIRFAYNAGGAGFSTYFWGLDDICIYANEATNDLEVLQITNGDVFNWWEYKSTPLEQAITVADGGLFVGTVFRINGEGNQTGVVITVDIMDDNMDVINTTASAPFDMLSLVNAETCPAQVSDTLYMSTDWTPEATGTYYVSTTISSDQEDEVVENDMEETVIYYTADLYGHDFEATMPLDVELSPRTSDGGSTAYDPTGYANRFHFPNSGTTAYGVEFIPGGQSQSGCFFNVVLYEGVGDETTMFDPNTAQIVAISSWTYDNEWNDAPVYFPFDDEYDLSVDRVYQAGILEDIGSDQQITVMATANTDTDNSTVVFQQAGNGSFVWFGGQTDTPAIRLITSAWVGVEQLADLNGINLFQNMPNPANNNTTIRYSLEQPMDVAFEVFDLQGRVVATKDLGTLSAGDHQVELSTSNLSNGIYTYTLIANNIRLTKQMIVAGR
ncbi:MAG: hypothetical protein ACJAV7_001179 [Flavobacteriales bacterium]|jgi:hypothetical protein